MSDLKAAFAAASQVKVRKSKLDVYRETLSVEDATALDSALSSTLAHADIARVLTANGLPIGETSIRRERERLDNLSQITGL